MHDKIIILSLLVSVCEGIVAKVKDVHIVINRRPHSICRLSEWMDVMFVTSWDRWYCVPQETHILGD